jgi:hypothetical protein
MEKQNQIFKVQSEKRDRIFAKNELVIQIKSQKLLIFGEMKEVGSAVNEKLESQK